MSDTIIGGIIHLHFIIVDKDCSVNSFSIERLNIHKVLVRILRINFGPTNSSDRQQLLHDDSFSIEDEYDMVDKLIASS